MANEKQRRMIWLVIDLLYRFFQLWYIVFWYQHLITMRLTSCDMSPPRAPRHVRVFKFPCYYDSENANTIFCAWIFKPLVQSFLSSGTNEERLPYSLLQTFTLIKMTIVSFPYCYPLRKLAHLLDQTIRFELATVRQASHQRPFIVLGRHP